MENLDLFKTTDHFLPWIDIHTFYQLCSEFASASDERRVELRYPCMWTCVHSKGLTRVEKGIEILSDMQQMLGFDPRQMKKVMYYKAVAHFRLDEFSKSAECVERCLEIQPNYWKALNLRKIIEARVRRDRVYNKIINGATNIGVVTIALAAANKWLYRRGGSSSFLQPIYAFGLCSMVQFMHNGSLEIVSEANRCTTTLKKLFVNGILSGKAATICVGVAFIVGLVYGFSITLA